MDGIFTKIIVILVEFEPIKHKKKGENTKLHMDYNYVTLTNPHPRSFFKNNSRTTSHDNRTK